MVQEFTPPVLPTEVRTLQEKLAAQAAMIESGEEPQPALLGLIGRHPKKLTVEERFHQLTDLLASCRHLHSHLISHRVAMVSFFSKLASHLRSLITAKVQQIKELEGKAKKLSKVVETTKDDELGAGVEDLKERLARFLRVVGMGAIHLLRSIESCRAALRTLEEDERRRQEMIDKLALRIGAHTEMRALDEELSDFEKNAGVQDTVRFSSYVSEYLVPFADLLEDVRLIDGKLRNAVDEIVALANTLDGSRPDDAPFMTINDAAVEHLLRAEADPVAIWNVVANRAPLDHAAVEVDVALAIGKEQSFSRALANIETLVHTRLEDCFEEEINKARQLNTPEGWRAYLTSFTASSGSEEARAALKNLELEDLAKARSANGVWEVVPALRKFVEKFPDGEFATEAEQSILRLRAETLSRARNASTPHDARGEWHTFIVLFPDRTPEESREAQEGLHGALVRIEPTPKRWRDYLSACPNGPLATEARNFIDAHAWVPTWAIAWGMEWNLPNGRCWADLEINGVRQRFRLIEPGVFLMGSPVEENGNKIETPVHEVTLTKPFWLADSECTQALWKAVTGTNPSKFQGEDRPVENVSWEDCILFARKLSELVPGLGARLPTEAEWEYACRAGSVGPFAGSGLWQDVAWVSENSNGETHAVKQRSANGWGLYDMHGNVAEWVSDGLRSYVSGKAVDPVGPAPTTLVCFRSGSWEWGSSGARAATRATLHRAAQAPWLGVRLVVTASSNESGWVYYATGMPLLDRFSAAPQHAVFLGDLTPVQVTGSYPPTANDAWGVHLCLIAGRSCTTFVTVHPPGEFVWEIPKHAIQFTAVLARADIVQSFHASWTYQILIDGKMVFQSVPLSERRSGIPVEIDIPQDARRMTVITDPLADNHSDHAILAWPYFRLKPVLEVLSTIPDESIFLGDLTPIQVERGWSNRFGFKNVDERVLQVAGKPCKTFLDVHPPARIRYEIPDEADRFTAIGSRWADERIAHGTWKYEVWIDSEQVFDSVPLHKSPEGIPIDVAIPSNARELTVIVNDLGDNYQDWATLAYPYFHFSESANRIARRLQLKPGEVSFRAPDGRWLCAQDREDRLVLVNNPEEPETRFRWRWRDSSECLFALSITPERYVRVDTGGRVHLAGPPDVQNEYFTLAHAATGRFAIRALGGPFLTAHDGLVSATATTAGPNESFEIVDPKYPSPPRPAALDTGALIEEAVIYLDFDKVRIIERNGKRRLIDFRGDSHAHASVYRARIEPALRGKALALDGVAGFLRLQMQQPLSDSSLTIAFWLFYVNYVRDVERSYWIHQRAGTQDALKLCTSWGRLRWGRGSEPALSRGEFQFRQWHHVAIVMEGMRNRLYVDGFPQMESMEPPLRPTTPIWFGRSSKAEAGSFCAGLLKDLLILNRALSPKEVRALALL